MNECLACRRREPGDPDPVCVALALKAGCAGTAGNCADAPAYIWTGPHGGLCGLCARHCAEWRQQTAGTALGPAAIRQAGA